jgi:apolipoprotein N-acyltransferase
MHLRTLWKSLAVVLSALLYTAAFPPFDLPWLMPIALLLLFWVLRDLRPALGLIAGFIHGFIAYGISASWFWEIFNVMALALFGILATFHALFGFAATLVRHRVTSTWRSTILIASCWTFLEFTRGELFWLKFPWFGVGVARGPHWLLPWLGVYGVTFLATLGIAMLFAKNTRPLGITLLILWGFAGLPTTSTQSVPPPQSIAVTTVQAETAPLKTYLKLSAEAPPETQLWVWPEYAYASDLTRNPKDYQTLLDFLKSRPGAILVLGTHTWVGEEGWHNTALTLTETGPIGRHFKNHPVHLFDDGIPGTEATAVSTPLGQIGTPVCFDCDFQDVIRRMTAAGAEFIVSPTMDAINWTLPQHEQHARLFQIRAAENRRWIAVAATSGVTQIINPSGHVVARLPLVQEATLSGSLDRRTDLTFYTRYGHAFPWLTPLLALACWAWPPKKRRPIPT